MKKSLGYITLVALSAIFLTACSSTNNIDEQENAIVAEYIVGSMLKYDRNYNENLVYTVEEDDTASEQESTVQVQSVSNQEDITSDVSDVDITSIDTTTDTSKQEEEQIHYTDLSSVYSSDNLKFSYSKYIVSQSYPSNYSDNAFGIDASEGKELLVVQFNIKNTSKKNQKCNLMKKGIEYVLTVNGKNTSPLLTMLLNDIQYYDMSIAAGKTKKVVLMFEIPEDTNIKTLSLIVSNTKEANKIVLK